MLITPFAFGILFKMRVRDVNERKYEASKLFRVVYTLFKDISEGNMEVLFIFFYLPKK